MNRNMKGEHFSRAELIAMAVEIGAIEQSEVTTVMKTHEFARMTKEHRLTLFMRGEAILDTRPGPALVPIGHTVDMEMVAALTKS